MKTILRIKDKVINLDQVVAIRTMTTADKDFGVRRPGAPAAQNNGLEFQVVGGHRIEAPGEDLPDASGFADWLQAEGVSRVITFGEAG